MHRAQRRTGVSPVYQSINIYSPTTMLTGRLKKEKEVIKWANLIKMQVWILTWPIR